MTQPINILTKPLVRLVGDVSHPDFRDAIAMMRDEAELVAASTVPLELIVVAQSRPGFVAWKTVDELRRASPPAGIVVIAGSWCEGELRTGKPWPGIERLYWYAFPSWWKRQMTLRAAGLCPDWARPGETYLRTSDSLRHAQSSSGLRIAEQCRGLVAISAQTHDTADALVDVLHSAGYATVCNLIGHASAPIRGAVAGIWEGGQLNDREVASLAKFCTRLSIDAAPVTALLDFPRRDRVDRALEVGAAAVLGKPWSNGDLVATLWAAVQYPRRAQAA